MNTHTSNHASPDKVIPVLNLTNVQRATVLHGVLARFLATISVAVICASTSVAQTISNGLVAYYPFNANANDASGNGNNGTPVNGAHLTTDKKGQANSAFEFDGIDDYITVPNTTNLTFSPGGFTLAAWASFSASTNANGTLVAKHLYSSPPGFLLGVYSNQALVQFFMSDSRLLTGPGYDDGLWHFIVATYDGSVQRLYVDGLLKISVYASYTPANNVDISMGAATGGGYFKGKMDDVRIYNRALSADEIRMLYILDADTSSGLVARYPFDGSATNILGTSNDGVVNGATLSYDRSGITDNAYAFTGSSEITFPGGPPVATNASFTYAFWMLSTLAGDYPVYDPSSWIWFVDRTTVTTNLLSLAVFTRDDLTNSKGTFLFLPRYDDGTEPGSVVTSAGIGGLAGGALTPQHWQHIAMVRDYGISFKLYVDGSLVASTPDNGKPLTLPAVDLGKNPNHGEDGLVGKFDDFRIYNRALTPYEATALYYSGSPWLRAVPATPVVGSGANLDLSVTPVGSLPMSYQWSLNGSPLPGQTGATLSLENLQTGQAGTYSIAVSNALGNTSVSVTLSLVDLKMFSGLVLAGPVPGNYRIEAMQAIGGTNTWQTLTNVTLTASPSIFYDADSPNHLKRFYRAVPLP